jgi:hypothetical protein
MMKAFYAGRETEPSISEQLEQLEQLETHCMEALVVTLMKQHLLEERTCVARLIGDASSGSNL